MSLSSSSEVRGPTPTASSSSISTQSDTRSKDLSTSDDSEPSGRFNVGIAKPPLSLAMMPATGAVSVEAPGSPADPERRPASAEVTRQRAPCPQPVRIVIWSLACAFVGGGLVSTLYGGLQLMTPLDQGQDPQRGAYAGLMVSGAVEMVIGLVAGMVTLNPAHLASSPSDPA